MTIDEFFDFNSTEYVAKLQALSDPQLQHQEIYNCRSRHGGAYSSVRGVMTAGLTFGVSLVAVPIGLRRREVATLRLALIQAAYTSGD
ncbi:hypothetical protein CLAFUW4_01948 [Fulvia fulva]|uniref:Uncharacterized protein n=1 Tax=Passalora fulva TaxID=5499 RepID=A0A9Q8P466_PASFU|nr:uncharacterized protein CLAFUR5_01942 [Fulvia fulva]KAK4636344.1 hypothetical protein CLAFUR4_01943 [Fulvia fulva]KAK4637492.1 hypothetical protein CLAFUR0_01945 [Fulvia fulva]UJO12496.1 hypothetical protein CLAFUR5_01942 [Fulvia fulva]WPV08444.1 hypothetical protein CLAFUW4_01948 [Fulvia fulva]WPV24775.1 hypothetical protein CLAFUW7_01947 [Fulvia fulva]